MRVLVEKRADERRRGREGPKTPSTPVSLSARRSDAGQDRCGRDEQNKTHTRVCVCVCMRTRFPTRCCSFVVVRFVCFVPRQLYG